MNRREIIQYIRQKTVLSEEQKTSLINMLYNHSNNFGSLCRWIKNLNIFSSEAFQELFSFERMEVVNTLIRGAEERIWKGSFEELVKIFFGKPSEFSKAILSQLRKEKESQIKALFVQLLCHFNIRPVENSSLWDYVSGLHHPDELIRCKVLHFLYKHYGGKSLSPILKEVIRVVPPPSLFFSMALNHYLRLNPEVMEDETIRRSILPSLHFSGGQTEKGRMVTFFQQMRYPISRHDFLSLIHTQEEPRISNVSNENLTKLRLERFEKIDSFINKGLPLFGK